MNSKNDDRKICIENIVKGETAKANNKQAEFFNDLTLICIKDGLTSSEYIEVYEKVIRNVMQICESRLKNSFANKRRYKEEIAAKKNRRQSQHFPKKASARDLCTDESDPNLF